MPQKTLSCWPLAFSAGLLGVGQNGLLVAIPVLVIQTNLSLSIWAALLMLGSMLFLPSSRGGKSKLPVLAVSLCCCGLWGIRCKLYSAWAGKHADGDRRCNNSGGAGILIIARIAYGLTVSAMVPACQVWALQRAGKGIAWSLWQPLAPASCGRLFGPLCAAAMLAIHPLAPMGLLMAAPLLALVMLLRLHGTSPRPTADAERQPEAGLCLICFARCY